MKRFLLAVVLCLAVLLAQASQAQVPYVKMNPTNQTGIEVGSDNASGYVKLRVYMQGQSDNRPLGMERKGRPYATETSSAAMLELWANSTRKNP